MRAVAVLFALIVVACRREDVPQSTRQPGAAAATSTSATKPVDLRGKKIEFDAPLTPPVISGCKTGATLDANGLVSEVRRTFAAGEKVHTSVWLTESPERLVMSVRALDDDDKEVAVISQPVNRAKAVTLTLAELPRGELRLETYWGGNIVCEQSIEVTSPSPRG